ncbi:MAG TPA: DNA repair exonuclease [Candidatus Dormibacteraeota bacterium]|nr:DNA repair exonuclease [Candidatus Dormibacteraeota bacterium]
MRHSARVRVLHCADIHLDTAFPGLGAEWSLRRRQATRSAIGRIAQLAAELRVDALTIAGDLYEDSRAGADTASFLSDVLGQVPCPVLIAPGNHDPFLPTSLYARHTWPQNVHIFRHRQFEAVAVAGMRICGAAHVQPKGTPDLFAGYQVPDGPPAVALVHGSEAGALQFEGGAKVDHAPFQEAEIAAAGFVFALCGHYHTPRSTPRLCYPGNPEPLTFGETGERGAMLVDFGTTPPTVTRHRVATFSVADTEVDISACTHRDAVIEAIRAAVPGRDDRCVRVRVVGDLQPTVAPAPQTVLDAVRGPERCCVIEWDTRLADDLDALATAPDIRGEFVRTLLGRPDPDSPLVQEALQAGLRALADEDPGLL